VTPPRPPTPADRSQTRVVALVLVGTMLVWMGGQWLGSALGWPARTAILLDLAALAGFTFALIVTFRIWRQRQKD